MTIPASEGWKLFADCVRRDIAHTYAMEEKGFDPCTLSEDGKHHWNWVASLWSRKHRYQRCNCGATGAPLIGYKSYPQVS